MFLSEYMLTKGVPGAPAADLKLAVDAPRKTAHGTVTITQAVSPPLERTTDVRGWFHVRQNKEIIVTLQSYPSPLLGALEFRAIIALPRWGAEGEGSFSFVAGETTYESGPVSAKPVEVTATATA